MKRLNMYLFGEEKISAHDAAWFYGVLGGALFLTLFVQVVTL